MSEPMYSPPPPPAPPPAAGPPASQQVQGPAMGLMITAVIGGLLNLLSLGVNVLGMGGSALSNMGGGGGGPADRYMQYMSGGAGIVFAILGLAVAGFIIWVSLQMKQLHKWTLAVVASIVAMIPCISPCCIIGLPIGIWAVIVLMKPEVKSSFVG